VLTRDALASDTSVTLAFPTIQWVCVVVVLLRGAAFSAAANGSVALTGGTYTSPSVTMPSAGWAVHVVAHGSTASGNGGFDFDSLASDEENQGVQDTVEMTHLVGNGSSVGCTTRAVTTTGWAAVTVAASG
jgi:hypothetical protein